eukprot:4895700-Amphidinium_carterae.1
MQDLVEHLLELQADPHAVDAWGETPLSLAQADSRSPKDCVANRPPKSDPIGNSIGLCPWNSLRPFSSRQLLLTHKAIVFPKT